MNDKDKLPPVVEEAMRHFTPTVMLWFEREVKNEMAKRGDGMLTGQWLIDYLTSALKMSEAETNALTLNGEPNNDD